MFNELNGIGQTETLPWVTVKELCDDGLVFTIGKITIKENVEGKFGVQDVAYIEIAIDDAKYVCSVKQSALLNTLRTIVDKDIDVSAAPCKIIMFEGKASTYYKFVDA